MSAGLPGGPQLFFNPVADSQTTQAKSNPIEGEIHDWNRVKRQELADRQTTIGVLRPQRSADEITLVPVHGEALLT